MVRFNYNRSSRRQVPRDFPAEFLRSSRVKGMPEIQAKRFLWIAFHLFPLSIDKIAWSLTIFIDFDFYLLSIPGSNYTWNWCYFERVTDLNREKTGRLKTWPISAIRRRRLKSGFSRKKKDFFNFFFSSNNIVWSFDSQLQLNCQQIHCLHESNFHFWMNRRTDVPSDINRWNR